MHKSISVLSVKFEALVKRVRVNVDILKMYKTKIDNSFPIWQFLIEAFTAAYRLDLNGSGGGILVYIREVRPSKSIPTDFSNWEGLFLELNLRKKKWVSCCSYNPHNNFIGTHVDSIGKAIDSLFARYENFILIGGFNTEESDITILEFCNIYSFNIVLKTWYLFICLFIYLFIYTLFYADIYSKA